MSSSPSKFVLPFLHSMRRRQEVLFLKSLLLSSRVITYQILWKHENERHFLTQWHLYASTQRRVKMAKSEEHHWNLNNCLGSQDEHPLSFCDLIVKWNERLPLFTSSSSHYSFWESLPLLHELFSQGWKRSSLMQRILETSPSNSDDVHQMSFTEKGRISLLNLTTFWSRQCRIRGCRHVSMTEQFCPTLMTRKSNMSSRHFDSRQTSLVLTTGWVKRRLH